MKQVTIVLILLITCILSCKKSDSRKIDTSYNPQIDISNFTSSTNINNLYYPLEPGREFVYEGQSNDGMERVEELRTMNTKVIMGITCMVVHFKAFIDGALVEETNDWYAQDNEGNVWYFGEQVDNYENGQIEDHDGSWEAGLDGAKPGIIMPAQPSAGFKYREEYYFNHAEDEAEIMSTGIDINIPFGNYSNCILTQNWTELEPGILEKKYYAPGVGLIKEENQAENEQLFLIEIN